MQLSVKVLFALVFSTLAVAVIVEVVARDDVTFANSSETGGSCRLITESNLNTTSGITPDTIAI